MSATLAEATAERSGGAAPYQRHRPERTPLCQIVEQHYPAFVTHMAQQERPLPDCVQREFDDYLRCGRLEHGFLRVRCDTCHAEHLVAFSCYPQPETMKSPESRVQYLWDPPKDSLPIVSDRKARR